MRSTLADSFDIVAPGLPPELVPPAALPILRRWAQELPPIPYGGFEVPLSGSPRVDFQQCLLATDDEPRRALEHLRANRVHRASGNDAHEAIWQRVDAFLTEWSNPSSLLRDGVEDFWLEFDGALTTNDLPPPSIFFGLRRDLLDSDERFRITAAVLELLIGRTAWGNISDNVRRAFVACNSPEVVSHVGVMLARDGDALRLNVKRLFRHSFEPYLRALEWPGDLEQASTTMTRVLRLVDHVTVCVDVGRLVYPQIGFECIFKEQPVSEPRWAELFDALVEQGWCIPEKRDALLAWTASCLTPNTTSMPWPAHLLRAALVGSPNRFSAIERRLSHVKIVLRPGHPPEAKGYFGFRHSWLGPADAASDLHLIPLDADPEEAALPVLRRRDRAASVQGERELNGALEDAIHDAVAFLRESRTRSGWWKDFPHSADGSDVWVTAFAGALLAGIDHDGARHAARRAWSLLERRRNADGGWGFNTRTSVDTDSTTWGLRLATAVGAGTSTRAEEAWRFFDKHIRTDGGLHCYRDEVLPRPLLFLGRNYDGSREGWCATPHTCIASAAAILDQRPREFLRRTQRHDGSWAAYWWEDTAYSTALAAESLTRAGHASDRPLVNAAVEWARARIEPNGAVRTARTGAESPFVTASCLLVLTLADDLATVREPLTRAVSWLLAAQDPEGSWHPSARMRVPRPDIVDPDDGFVQHAVFLDERGIFTAARVASALDAARRRLS